MSNYPWEGKKATYYVDEINQIKRMLADAKVTAEKAQDS